MTQVLLVAQDDGACGQYRMMLPAAALFSEDVTWQFLDDRVMTGAVEADVIVWQRPQHRLAYEAIVKLIDKGFHVMIELDDLYDKLPETHEKFELLSPARNPTNNWGWTRKAVEAAGKLICSTPAIAEAYPEARATVVPNYIPEWNLKAQRTLQRLSVPRVGWTGNPLHHPNDIEQVGSSVSQLGFARKLALVAFGARYTLSCFNAPGEFWGPVPFDMYMDQVRNFDIGLAPLADSPFHRAKSWNKALEYASLGVPYIASPSPEYLRLDFENQRIARSEQEWLEHLNELCSMSFQQLDEIGAALRAEVKAKRLTVQDRCGEFLVAWQSAVPSPAPL